MAKRKHPPRNAIKDAGAVPEWAKEAAKRYMCTHESRFYITPLMTKNRYYVVYALRGPKAEGRKCGIFPDWDGTSGAKQQVLNCCARHTTASSWMAANVNGNVTLPIVPSEQPAVEPAPEFPLCPEQQHALDLALEGRNLFITGSGGCGKSVLVKALHRALSTQQKTVHLLAPTGQAAINIGGRTAYNYAGWGPTDPGQMDFTLAEKAKGKLVFGRFTRTDVLIIDEISMVENQFFERLSDVIATTRKEPPGLQTSRPFGGIQIIAVGDFCQLPPVKPFQYCPIEISTTGEGKYKISTPCGNMKESAGMHFCPRDESHGRFRESEKWAFNSPTWKQCNFSYVHLTTVHRQKDQDFIRMLQNMRMGQVNEDDLDILLQNRPVLDGTVLFSHKDMVRKRNEEELYKIKNTARTYSSVDHQVPEYDADDKHRYEKHLNLKVDMPVILLSNSLSLDRVIVDLSRVWDGRQIYVALSRARSLEGLQVIGHKNRLRQKLPLDAEVTRFMKEVEELSGTAMRA
ncbi:ATP-dependent DNA helicase PIF1 [Colletotrichum spinosum]|uniref:ATP-dependent DNA helicase n=1 Tax=Colletotrichum spinosum TaxID=1347390 RepID=A0A4R8QRJ7_9PEZI|nr:ATP-dependent DNA helicase PIF1 [Colletotrichum spinosum]